MQCSVRDNLSEESFSALFNVLISHNQTENALEELKFRYLASEIPHSEFYQKLNINSTKITSDRNSDSVKKYGGLRISYATCHSVIKKLVSSNHFQYLLNAFVIFRHSLIPASVQDTDINDSIQGFLLIYYIFFNRNRIAYYLHRAECIIYVGLSDV